MLRERGFFHRQINLYKNLNFYLTITNNYAKSYRYFAKILFILYLQKLEINYF